VDLAAKTVTVDHDQDQASVQTIKSEIEDQGYDIIE
jgi:copper chaperone